MAFLYEEWSVFQLVKWQSLMLSEISFHVRFSTHGFSCYLLEAWLCSPFYLILLPTCFIYFCGCRNCLLTLMITKSKWIEKASIPRIQPAGAQGYSSSYLSAVSVLQWSDFSSRFAVFIILRGQRRAFCQRPYKLPFPIQYTSTLIYPPTHTHRTICNRDMSPPTTAKHTLMPKAISITCTKNDHFVLGRNIDFILSSKNSTVHLSWL